MDLQFVSLVLTGQWGFVQQEETKKEGVAAGTSNSGGAEGRIIGRTGVEKCKPCIVPLKSCFCSSMCKICLVRCFLQVPDANAGKGGDCQKLWRSGDEFG